MNLIELETITFEGGIGNFVVYPQENLSANQHPVIFSWYRIKVYRNTTGYGYEIVMQTVITERSWWTASRLHLGPGLLISHRPN